MALSTMPNLRKKAKVVAAHDLVDVPEGTPGKVVLVNGLTWIRYWVRFANGVTRGSINRHDLATPEEWERHLAGDDAVATSGASAAAGADSGGDDDAGGGGRSTPNGTLVPARLLERSQAARARLAA